MLKNSTVLNNFTGKIKIWKYQLDVIPDNQEELYGYTCGIHIYSKDGSFSIRLFKETNNPVDESELMNEEQTKEFQTKYPDAYWEVKTKGDLKKIKSPRDNQETILKFEKSVLIE